MFDVALSFFKVLFAPILKMFLYRFFAVSFSGKIYKIFLDDLDNKISGIFIIRILINNNSDMNQLLKKVEIKKIKFFNDSFSFLQKSVLAEKPLIDWGLRLYKYVEKDKSPLINFPYTIYKKDKKEIYFMIPFLYNFNTEKERKQKNNILKVYLSFKNTGNMLKSVKRIKIPIALLKDEIEKRKYVEQKCKEISF